MPLKDLAHFYSDESKKTSLVSDEQSKILVVAPNRFGPTCVLPTVNISTEEGFFGFGGSFSAYECGRK